MEITFSNILQVFGTCLIVYVVVIVLTRLFGLRSFSKMSGFDFAKTVAVGSMIGSVATNNTPWLLGIFGLAFLFLFHFIVALLRRFVKLKYLIDNKPVLLMYNGEILHANLKSVEVEESDLNVVLRRANVLDPAQVRAVIMETTGDFSVLHNGDESKKLHPSLLDGVSGLPENFTIASNKKIDNASYQ